VNLSLKFHAPVLCAALNRIGSLRDKGQLSPNLEGQRQNGGLDVRGDVVTSSVQGLHRVALYVLGEKNQMKVGGGDKALLFLLPNKFDDSGF
jgi:hypothetical protein